MNLLISVGIRILELMFFGGWIGSLLVIILTGIEDLEVVFSGNDSAPKPGSQVIVQEAGNRH